MKEKGDPKCHGGIFYSGLSQRDIVFTDKRTRLILSPFISGLGPQGQKASDYDNSDPVPPRQNVVPTAEKTDSSQQGLEFLFSPLLEE
ncbi:hypothetical protein Tco_0047868 [Tanacetum coccineum]